MKRLLGNLLGSSILAVPLTPFTLMFMNKVETVTREWLDAAVGGSYILSFLFMFWLLTHLTKPKTSTEEAL